MNISFQNVDKASALLTLNVEKTDYQAKVEKSLKNIRQKMDMPGFRRGMVPMGLVKKRFEKSVLREEVEEMVSEAIVKYLQDNKVPVLGQPIPSRENNVDFDNMEEFTFKIDVALTPDIKVELSPNDTIDYYTIDMPDERVNNRIQAYAYGDGTYESAEEYRGDKEDMLKGTLIELDENGAEKEGGIRMEEVSMLPSYMKDDEQKLRFEGRKVGDTIVFNPAVAWKGNEAELASLFNMEKEKAVEIKSDFSYLIAGITRYVVDDLNQNVFDRVLGPGVVDNEADFRERVKEAMQQQDKQGSDLKFLLDIRAYILGKIDKPQYAEGILKRYVKINNGKDKNGEEVTDEQFQQSLEGLTWQLIRNQLMAAAGIDIEKADLLDQAKEYVRTQFFQYGMSVPAHMLDSYARGMLEDEEKVEKLAEQAVNEKLSKVLQQQVTLRNHVITVEEFDKFFE
ncbi:MAG: trigger factor family protein [Prevotellaceae bacterium]|jgi:trigger factor|nr:trigger factor family protein [Prevotellaceae bacterium]